MTVRESGNYRFLKIGLNITAEQWFHMPVPKEPGEAEESTGQAMQENGELSEDGAFCVEPMEEGTAAKRMSGQRRFFIGKRQKEQAGQKGFLGKCRKEQAGQKDFLGKCRKEQAGQKGSLGKCRKEQVGQKASLGKRRSEQERARIEELERMHRRQQYETSVELLERAIGSLMRTAVKGVGELDFCACVYGSGMRKLLLEGTPLAVHWNKAWTVPEFTDYRAYRWSAELLTYATCSRFVVLGVAPDIPLILKSCARRMKSLRWILQEKDYDEKAKEFIEDFYEDYGLVISVQTVAGRNAFRALCLESVEPVCILDFTDETKFFFGGLEPGSVWLDFLSAEEKAKRLERLAKKVSYYSLKRLWANENPTKTYFLDSTDKSGYNTEVNRLTICDDKGF